MLNIGQHSCSWFSRGSSSRQFERCAPWAERCACLQRRKIASTEYTSFPGVQQALPSHPTSGSQQPLALLPQRPSSKGCSTTLYPSRLRMRLQAGEGARSGPWWFPTRRYGASATCAALSSHPHAPSQRPRSFLSTGLPVRGGYLAAPSAAVRWWFPPSAGNQLPAFWKGCSARACELQRSETASASRLPPICGRPHFGATKAYSHESPAPLQG